MKLNAVPSPHIHSGVTTRRIMLDVLIALIPAFAVGVIVLGIRALFVALICVASTVGSEWLYCLLTKRKNTVTDGSAAVSGLLLAMTLPASVPFWQAALGGVFAIVVVKCLFGGLGQNIFNPALAARAFLMLIYPVGMTRYVAVDGISSATPMHEMAMHSLPEASLLDMLLGNCGGSIGEISALALLAGGAYLVIRKVITPRIPVAYLGTVALLSLIFARSGNAFVWMLYSLLGGGVMLGAIFMATDYTTSPTNRWGQLVFGVGCGVLTFLFRYFGLYPEGVTYAILLMNASVWAIDRYMPHRYFGEKKEADEK